jgi:hypothetical protein
MYQIPSAGRSSFAANERVWPSKRFLGEWKGSWNGKDTFTLKVSEIKAGTAKVEYTVNGRTERGTATIDRYMLNFNGTTFATKDGRNGISQLTVGSYTKNGQMAKV